ncbi:MAG: response regulator, partial [Clostridia bacterium]|nr:response regulator [Clostridia bacterium]
MSKILIADDDRSIAELISDALTDEGFETEIVSDGDEALRRVSGGTYSLILLDIMMPNTDGLEVCRRIRDSVSCPIIFVSAKNRTIDTLLGLGMGADDYIAKPFVLDELVARVKAHIRRDNRSGVQASSN